MSAVISLVPPSTSIPARRYQPPSIAGDYTELTAKQEQLSAIASELGTTKFAQRAEQIDRDAVFPFENNADMRAVGLLKICVPEAHGGWGADFATYVMTAAEIGRQCGATALTMLPWTAELCIDRLGRECLYEAGKQDETDVL